MSAANISFLRAARLGLCAAAVIAALEACAGLGGIVSPALDALNHAAPFWFFFAIIGAVATLFICTPGRVRVLALIAFGLAALFQLWLIVPESLAAPARAAVAEGQRVRIVWLNAESGQARVEDVAGYLAASGADFLLLAEYHAEGDVAPGALGALYPHVARCTTPHDCNVAILSKRAPARVGSGDAANQSGLRVTWAEYDIGGAPLRLVGAHVRRRAARAAQLRALEATLGEADAADTVLAGDFNATPWSFALKRFDGASGLQRLTRALPTWPAQSWTRLNLPAPAPFMAIDHVYAGAGWRLVSLKRGPRTASDHYPIEAEFVWAGE